MAIIIPYQSQVGISNANGGSGGQYRSASAFVSPGAESTARGLQIFARGLDQFTGAAFGVYSRNQREAVETELIQDIQRYQDNMSSQDDAYRNEFSGENALDAEKRARERYTSGLNELQNKWKGNPYAEQYIQQRAGGIALAGVGHMRDYGNREQERWRDSVFAGEQARYMATVADMTMSMEEVDMASRRFGPEMRDYYRRKGMDPARAEIEVRAEYEKAMGMREENRINMMMQAGDFDEVERQLGGQPRYARLPQEIASILDEQAERNGVPPELAKAVAMQESRGNAKAYSSAGAMGVMQLMDGTARDMGVSDPWNATQNIRGGVEYLKKLLDRYDGDKALAVMAYNWGMGNVDSWRKTGRGIKTERNPTGAVPKETRDYMSRVLGDALPVESPGMVERGNIDLATRPRVRNGDGSISTVKSFSAGIDGQEVLLPLIGPGGKELTQDQAIDMYRSTGRHLGKFETVKDANDYAELLHYQQEALYGAEADVAVRFLPADRRMRLRQKNEYFRGKANEEREAQYAATMFESVLTILQDSPTLSAYEAEARKQIGAIEDPQMRKKITSSFESDLAQRQKLQDAQDSVQAQKLYDLTMDMPPVEKTKYYQENWQGSAEGLEKAIAQAINPPVYDTEKAIEDYDSLLLEIDEIDNGGRDITTEEIESRAWRNGYTKARRDKALAYHKSGGQAGYVTSTKVNEAWKRLSENKGKKVPADLRDLVLKVLPAGKSPSQLDIDRAVSDLIVNGEARGSRWGIGFGRDMTRADAIRAGYGDSWLSDADQEAIKSFWISRYKTAPTADQLLQASRDTGLMRIIRKGTGVQ